MIIENNTILAKGDNGLLYFITEGTGDALFVEDIEDDYIDYIYYDIYETLEDYKEDNVYDGGCLLLKVEYNVELAIKEIEEFEKVKLS